MRIVRLFGVVLTILTAGLLWATPAGAQPPSKLTDHITDSSGVLTGSDRAAVSSAIDRLSSDRHIQLWVIYVDNFSRFKPENWASQTRGASGMGDHDALLAVATNTKLYSFSVSPKILAPAEANSLQSTQIESAVNAKNWSGAAVAAADGLDKSAKSPSSSKRTWLLIAVGVAAAVVLLIVIVLLYRRHRRRAAQQVSIGGGGSSLGQALSTADTRLRQVSDYAARHHENVGAEAQTRLEEAKRHLAAAHGNESTSESDAIAYANRASTLAAEAQKLANADVLGAHRTRGR